MYFEVLDVHSCHLCLHCRQTTDEQKALSYAQEVCIEYQSNNTVRLSAIILTFTCIFYSSHI